MELHKENLRRAVDRLGSHEPDEDVWNGIEAQLKEVRLQDAVDMLPVYEPSAGVWNEIEAELPERKPKGKMWWAAAAAAMVAVFFGLWNVQNRGAGQITYTLEQVDSRLLLQNENDTDRQYEKLKSYCLMDALVCNSKDFHQLREEYEALSKATRQLQQVMGAYNTEPELMRQLTALEREKAGLLNEMSKLI